jgi:hypothetical protein
MCFLVRLLGQFRLFFPREVCSPKTFLSPPTHSSGQVIRTPQLVIIRLQICAPFALAVYHLHAP